MMVHSSENLAQGFWLIVGSQIVTVICGAWLLRRLAGEPVRRPALQA